MKDRSATSTGVRAWIDRLDQDDVRGLVRWAAGAMAALYIITLGYFGAIISPTRSVTYRAFNGLPRIVAGDAAPDVGIVSPVRNDRTPRWLWFALIGWWAGFLWVDVAWVLLIGVRTIPQGMRMLANLDTILFLPKERRSRPLVIQHPPLEIRYDRVPIPKSVRYRVLERDGFRCQYCGRSPVDDDIRLHVDHRIPVSRGGTNDMSNLVTACQDCNLGKGAWHPSLEHPAPTREAAPAGNFPPAP